MPTPYEEQLTRQSYALVTVLVVAGALVVWLAMRRG